MFTVDTDRDLRPVFAQARQRSAGTIEAPGSANTGRAVAIVTPGRLIMPVACPPTNAVSAEMLAAVRRIVSENPKQQITVIADNNIVKEGAFTAREANALIPFLGYLMGMAFDGHTVVVFEGHPSALAAGCKGSTLLLVDQAMLGHLQSDCAQVAASSMEAPQILIFGRDGSLAKIVPKGNAAGPHAPVVPPVRKKRWWWPFDGDS